MYLARDLPIELLVYVDPNMFERVMINLVNNGVQAMPDGENIDRLR